MHAWWCARRTERTAVGRAWPPKKIAAPPAEEQQGEEGPANTPSPNLEPEATHIVATPDTSPPAPNRREQLLERYKVLGKEAKADFKARGLTKNSSLDAIEHAVEELEEWEHGESAFTGPTVLEMAQQRMAADKQRDDATRGMGSPPDTPDEGPEISMPDVAVAAIRSRYNALPAAAQQWTSELVKQGNTGHSWKLKDNVSVRRYEIYRGVLALAEHYLPAVDPDDEVSYQAWIETGDEALQNTGDIVSTIVNRLVDDLMLTDPPGLMLSQLNAEQASKFAEIATDLTEDRCSLIYSENGTPSIVAA
jgi:hypothetical protein